MRVNKIQVQLSLLELFDPESELSIAELEDEDEETDYFLFLESLFLLYLLLSLLYLNYLRPLECLSRLTFLPLPFYFMIFLHTVFYDQKTGVMKISIVYSLYFLLHSIL